MRIFSVKFILMQACQKALELRWKKFQRNAAANGSQWIFITPHDIRSVNMIAYICYFDFLFLFHNCLGIFTCLSMVEPGDRIKKQQMAAPRS
jgi:hypothetical protein